ncbi:unnamed protein product [Triticum turgidum subsp. durum]|uniref:Uncharacterized protein n=1 Tax=Triticum turgidum subsp. durum TaxID=4567 RepID=A0A9R0ZTM9_TRITD|nr:unnamed protein product [Triticum turgidum subsp. durum]
MAHMRFDIVLESTLILVVLCFKLLRLDRMLYVGLTEDHEESARLFAHMVGAQVLSQSGALKLDVQEDQPSGTDSHSSMLDPEDEETNEHMNSTHGWKNNEALNTTEDDHGKGNMTVGKLMETYEGCIAKLRKSQSSRRRISLKKVEAANFTKAARRHVPEAILNQIISLNSLDMELYEYAKKIFEQEHLMLKGQHPMVVQQKQLADQMVRSSSYEGQHPMVVQHKQLTDQKDWIDAVCESWSCSTWWKVASFGLGIAVTTVFVVFVVTGRRTLKLKV